MILHKRLAIQGFRNWIISKLARLELRKRRGGICVLVVEEDAAQRKAVIRAISNAGFRVFAAKTARIAEAMVAKRRFDAVIYGLTEANHDVLDFALNHNREQDQAVPQLVILPKPRSAYLNRTTRQIRYCVGRFDWPTTGEGVAATLGKVFNMKERIRQYEREGDGEPTA